MLKRPNEKLPWNPSRERNKQPHDEPMPETALKHYFSPERYYCVETLCAPCGAVIAWANFAKSESASKIVELMESVYPNPESHPQYISSLDGSAPNLVIVDTDNYGRPYFKKAFNTKACEQLNAWLGGFDSILKRMVPSNFDWFLHTMLFYHSTYVIQKQQKKQAKMDNDADDADDKEDAENSGETYDDIVNDDIEV
ncbi:hypothetical protein BDQ12DRAFT_701133 [Crucibulum laeve]|uniref:Uncharacterized protein n=1 Tax=Crucibulum laeve TaxID=68775 RepID=A0A5C3LFY2_9AGAR|nr:hypothetical protein BDQ12DRAFT_701660 [Crucibulum laeve]TFK32503.1 hypothetical protein BDQ12DRAFT_701133 [Crucibulum laeve]